MPRKRCSKCERRDALPGWGVCGECVGRRHRAVVRSAKRTRFARTPPEAYCGLRGTDAR